MHNVLIDLCSGERESKLQAVKCAAAERFPCELPDWVICGVRSETRACFTASTRREGRDIIRGMAMTLVFD